MNNKRKGFWIIRMLLIAAYMTGVICIAVYPFPNRNLTLHFIAEDTSYEVLRGSADIASENCREVKFDKNADRALIKKIYVFGNSKTIVLKEIGCKELFGYIESVDQGEVQWLDDGILFTGIDNIHILMNDNFVKELKRLSASFLQERIMLEGYYTCIVIFILFIYAIIQEKKKEGNWNNHGPVFEIKMFMTDIRQYGQYMVFAAKTDLKAEVADSYLNRLWWLLEPFFNMIVYVIVFGNVMGNSVKNYSTFIYSALLMWNLFSKTVNYSVKLVRNNKDIISKVYIPKFIILLSNMFLNLLKLLFSLIVLVIMMVIFQIHIGMNILWVVPAYVVMIMMAFGIGMIFMHFGVYIDDLSYAVGILLNMLMFLSGIFYHVMSTLPEPLNIILMSLNPVAVTIDTMRKALLENAVANIPVLGMWFFISVIMCGIGVHIVYRNENSYVKII